MYHPLSLNGYSKIINAVKRQRNLGLALGGRILEGPAKDVFVSDLMTGKHFYCLGLSKSNFCRSWLPLRPLSEGSLIIVNKVKSRKQIGKNFLLLSVYAKFREPVPIPDFISYPIGNRCKL